MTAYEEKCARLRELMRTYARRDVMLAFSGGVDSSLLLRMACEAAAEAGTRVWAVTIHTALHPVKEASEAQAEAEAMGAIHRTLEVDELAGAGIDDNPPDRCYRCKHYMFTKVKELAAELGAAELLEGTNSDDLLQYRPGIRAVRELGLKSPLMEAGFTKEEVRRLAAEYGIRAASKPSTPCLATRFPYGAHLSYEEMRRAERIEAGLRALGFYNVRARIHDRIVRLEVDADDLEKLVRLRREAVDLVKREGYDYAALDLEGFRSGSQDIVLDRKPLQNGKAKGWK